MATGVKATVTELPESRVRVQPLEGGLALGPLFTDFPVAVLEAVE